MTFLPTNEIESYLAGLLLADGCVVRNGSVWIQLVQQTRARPVLEQLSAYYNRPIWNRKNGFVMAFKLPPEYKRSILDLPLGLRRHYWRGVVDGDGSVINQDSKSGLRVTLYWNPKELYVGEGFQSYLCSLGVRFKIRTPGKLFAAEVVRDGRRLAEHLYVDASIALPWKLEKVF